MACLRERPRFSACCSASTSLRRVAARSGCRKISPARAASRVGAAGAVATTSCDGVMLLPSAFSAASLVALTRCGSITAREYGHCLIHDFWRSMPLASCASDGFPIEAQLANGIERQKSWIKQWPYSRAVMLPHLVSATSEAAEKADGSSITPSHDVVATAPAAPTREAARAGEIFRQPDLAATLRKLVEAEQQALKRGLSRKQAIYAAYDRFYKGDIAQEIARSTQEQGGLITTADLAKWQVKTEEPVKTTYKGIDVYKLTVWTQGPSMLQALNILENFDIKSMGYNSARYIHTLYQAMSLAFADRDFYYGDPYFPPEEPVLGLLSKEYARERAKLINPNRNDPNI